jgi:hypothetical protein
LKNLRLLPLILTLALLAPLLQGCTLLEIFVRALERASITVPESDSTPPVVELEVTGLGTTYHLRPGDPGVTVDVAAGDQLYFKAVARDEDGGVAYVAVEGEIVSTCAGPGDLGRTRFASIRQDFRDTARPGETALKIRQITWFHDLALRTEQACADLDGYVLTEYSGFLYAVGENFHRLRAHSPTFSFRVVLSASAPLLAATPEEGTPDIVPIWTETPAPPVFTFSQNAHCRRGPGLAYSILTSLLDGQQVQVEGRNQAGTWLWIRLPDGGARCWVALSTGVFSGDLEELQIVEAPPPPPPAAPSNLQAGTTCTTNQYAVTLTWQDNADNETGYRVYRDGQLLATLGPNATQYVDNPPGSGPYSYYVEAYNEAGAAPSGAVQDAGCII